MSRAERRRAERRRAERRERGALSAMLSQTPIFAVGVVRVADFEQKLRAIFDPRVGRAIARFVTKVSTGAEDPLCLFCDVKPGIEAAAVAVVTPAVTAPAGAVIAPICPACAVADEESLLAAASEKIRAAFVGAREISPANLSPVAGRA